MPASYVPIRDMGKDPSELINTIDLFKRVYRILPHKKVDEKYLMRILNAYGYKSVKYTLDRLMDEYISDGDMQQPYRHLEFVTGRFKRAYDAKVAAGKNKQRQAV